MGTSCQKFLNQHCQKSQHRPALNLLRHGQILGKLVQAEVPESLTLLFMT